MWSDLGSFPGQEIVGVTPRNDKPAILSRHPNSSENLAQFFLQWYGLDPLSKVETGIIYSSFTLQFANWFLMHGPQT